MSLPQPDVRIMAHPERGLAARALRDRLSGLDPVVVWDPEPHGPPSAQRAARRAWRETPRPGATHLVVLQDDVSVPMDFAQRLVALLAEQPARPLGLFATWVSRTGQAVRLAAYLGLDWVPVLGSALSATGVALPVDVAVEYAEFLGGDVDRRDSLSMYDFLHARAVEPVVAAPNLVQHDVPYVASIWPEKFVQGPRRSACYLAAAHRVGGGGLGRPVVLPHLSPDTLRSTTTVHPVGDARPHTIPSWRYAQRIGYDTGQLLGLFGHPNLTATRRALAEQVDAAFQYEIWLTGFLVGHVLSGAAPRGGGTEGAAPARLPDLGTAAAHAASRTLAAGCLARVLSLAVVDRLTSATADLVGQAMRQGMASPTRS